MQTESDPIFWWPIALAASINTGMPVLNISQSLGAALPIRHPSLSNEEARPPGQASVVFPQFPNLLWPPSTCSKRGGSRAS